METIAPVPYPATLNMARYQLRRPDDASTRSRLRVLAAARRRLGYRLLGILLACEGMQRAVGWQGAHGSHPSVNSGVAPEAAS